ncbi:MAG: FprA family A-type flavoprotein [Candidatus Omnitrophica bacterium]|nr:FprA family A-type flavoprotein [Candidatus Omnitrophota bacterium]
MVEIKKGIYWTGYIDWDLRNFHGYSTPSGSTYNAYLILDEKPTLIDTVKYYGFEQMLHRIKQIIDPAKIRYIVSNHTEMDHSGSIGELLKLCPKAEVICSPKGHEGLTRHFLSAPEKDKPSWNFKVVNNGETVSLGKRTLQFFLTPMVHWPDSMVSFCEEEKILFSNDAFGQHHASSQRFVDEAGLDIILKEAAKYYANIVMPYGPQVLKALEALGTLKLEMICPSHGLIWREKTDIQKIVSLYQKWANYESDVKAVIIYDTMWHSTEKMALKLYELLDVKGVDVKLVNLKDTHISDAMTEVMSSRVVCIGSPILNNRVLPAVGGFLTYLKGLKPKNRFGFAFGSYGWAKVGFKELEQALEEAGIKAIADAKYFQYVPAKSELDSLNETADKIKQLLDGK